MSIEVGMRVKAICKNKEIYEGILTHICLGISKEDSTQASIIIKEDSPITYGQVHLWCNGLDSIEQIN